MKRFEAWCVKNKHIWIQPIIVVVLFWFVLILPLLFFSPLLGIVLFFLILISHLWIVGLILDPEEWKIRFDRKMSHQPKLEIEKFKENPVLWINENFSTSQSVVRFILERAFFDSIPNESLILNLRLIPKSKQLNAESLKKIIPHLNWIPPLEVDPLKREEAFAEFDESLIVKIWSSPFEIIEVLSLFEAVYEGVKLEKANNFKEIMDQLDRKEKNVNFPDKIQISSSIKGFLLLTRHSYKVASYDFSNCVESYFEKNTNIFVFYNLNSPYACVEVDNKGNVLEIRGVRNKLLSPYEQSMIRIEISSRIGLKL